MIASPQCSIVSPLIEWGFASIRKSLTYSQHLNESEGCVQHVFDRAYYLNNLERNKKLAAEAKLPAIREAHLRMAEFYALALEVTDEVEPQAKSVSNLR